MEINRVFVIILLCIWVSFLFADSIYFKPQDKGAIALFLVNVILTKIGKKLDKGYKCPVYCGVTHTHYFWEEDEIKDEKTKQPTINGVSGHGVIASR